MNGQSERDLTINELKETFLLLKKKGSGYDGINFSVIKTCLCLPIKPLMNIFNSSVAIGIFPDERKIARVTPILLKLVMTKNWEIRNQSQFCHVFQKYWKA